MLKTEIIQLLRCPEDHSPLNIAPDDVVHRVNTAIRGGAVSNRGGDRVEKALDGGLLRADGAVLYPIIDQIPILLRDEGISLDQLPD